MKLYHLDWKTIKKGGLKYQVEDQVVVHENKTVVFT